ncbi:hypothetical protein AKO1_014738, partial [Acrasis kona]
MPENRWLSAHGFSVISPTGFTSRHDSSIDDAQPSDVLVLSLEYQPQRFYYFPVVYVSGYQRFIVRKRDFVFGRDERILRINHLRTPISQNYYESVLTLELAARFDKDDLWTVYPKIRQAISQDASEPPSMQKDIETCEKLILENRYVGDTKNGVAHGYGTKRERGSRSKNEFLTGEYVGEWKNGKRFGDGVLKVTIFNSVHNGVYTVTYDGYWKDGVCDGRGKSSIQFQHDQESVQVSGEASYEGEWMNGFPKVLTFKQEEQPLSGERLMQLVIKHLLNPHDLDSGKDFILDGLTFSGGYSGGVLKVNASATGFKLDAKVVPISAALRAQRTKEQQVLVKSLIKPEDMVRIMATAEPMDEEDEDML